MLFKIVGRHTGSYSVFPVLCKYKCNDDEQEMGIGLQYMGIKANIKTSLLLMLYTIWDEKWFVVLMGYL